MCFATNKYCFSENKAQILSSNKKAYTYQIQNETGNLRITDYEIYSGIHLVFRDAHIQGFHMDMPKQTNVLEITHCREGRVEYAFDDSLYYLSPGDIAVTLRKEVKESTAYYPMRHYHGVSVVIDIDQAPNCLSCLLDDVTVRPHALAEKFCSEHPCFVARSTQQIAHIFSELYAVPEAIQFGYYKVKVLELMLFLSGMLEVDKYGKPSIPVQQVTLAKAVSRYLSENITEKFTLNDLARQFNVSVSYIQNCFKAVYGASIAAFVRNQKMQEAAILLKTTDRTVLDIAGQFGYDNASKFAKAFRDVMEITPNEYRKS